MSSQGADSDAELVRRCRTGDQSAWAGLVQRYQRLVYAIVMRMGFDEHDSADVFQTVFTRLLDHLPRISDPERLQAWIVTTARREALLRLKRSRRTVSMTRPEDEEDAEGVEWDIADEAPLPEDALAEVQQQHQVRNALDRMDERCRSLLLLLFGEGERQPYEFIATTLGISVGSIGPTRARCLDKLRKLVE
jgi:RNA polymerase sigma factor (sigma-70 family)